MESSYGIPKTLKELQTVEGNKSCFDCGTPDPQWISASFGIWVCCRCAGLHRSLGVHLSFIRSIKFDKIKDEEIRKMQVGGNANAAEFFQSKVDFNSKKELSLKYRCKSAALYRDKIQALSEGKSWSYKEAKKRLKSKTVALLDNKKSSDENCSSLTLGFPSPNGNLQTNATSELLKNKSLDLKISSLLGGWSLLAAGWSQSSYLLKSVCTAVNKLKGKDGWSTIDGDNFPTPQNDLGDSFIYSYQNSLK